METHTKVQETAIVLEQQALQTNYFHLRLRSPLVARAPAPGQFIHLLPRSHDSFDPLLRRAFSIMKSDGDTIEIVYRAGGKGTRLLSALQPDETIDVIGPLGHGFEMRRGKVVLAGGGIGVPPLVNLAHHLNRQEAQDETHDDTQSTLQGKQRAEVFVGARSQHDIVCVEEFEQLGLVVTVATEDGSRGELGRVTQPLERFLAHNAGAAVDTTIYACGPLPMLRAVAALAARNNVPCQVSLEENMPCGIGVCNGCVVPVCDGADDYGRYRRICTEGPVMWSHHIDWSHTS